MREPIQIDRDAYYTDRILSRLLGLRVAVLARARKSGALRYTRAGGPVLYRGDWFIDWFEADSSRHPGPEMAGAVEGPRQ